MENNGFRKLSNKIVCAVFYSRCFSILFSDLTINSVDYQHNVLPPPDLDLAVHHVERRSVIHQAVNLYQGG